MLPNVYPQMSVKQLLIYNAQIQIIRVIVRLRFREEDAIVHQVDIIIRRDAVRFCLFKLDLFRYDFEVNPLSSESSGLWPSMFSNLYVYFESELCLFSRLLSMR